MIQKIYAIAMCGEYEAVLARHLFLSSQEVARSFLTTAATFILSMSSLRAKGTSPRDHACNSRARNWQGDQKLWNDQSVKNKSVTSNSRTSSAMPLSYQNEDYSFYVVEMFKVKRSLSDLEYRTSKFKQQLVDLHNRTCDSHRCLQKLSREVSKAKMDHIAAHGVHGWDRKPAGVLSETFSLCHIRLENTKHEVIR